MNIKYHTDRCETDWAWTDDHGRRIIAVATGNGGDTAWEAGWDKHPAFPTTLDRRVTYGRTARIAIEAFATTR